MPGANPLVDRAVRLKDRLDSFLRQDKMVTPPAEDSWCLLAEAVAESSQMVTA